MASKNINYSKLVKDKLHGPCVDGNVLYARADGVMTAELTEYEKSLIKDAKYIEACKHTYNSPTNIRKVFITGSRVIVQTYCPYIKRGQAATTGNWIERKLETDMFEQVEDRLNYNLKRMEWAKNKAAGVDAGAAPSFNRITGNILSAMSAPWVCSNIEEIYFDYTAIASDDILQVIQQAGDKDSIIPLTNRASRKCGNSIKKSDTPRLIFEAANGLKVQDIRKRYPRLKIIGMVSNLEEVLSNPSMNKIGNSFEALSSTEETWITTEPNMSLVKSIGGITMISILNSDLPVVNVNFSVREGVYKFDNEVLILKVNKLVEKAKQLAREKANGEASKAAEEEKDTSKEVSTVDNKAKEIIDLFKSSIGNDVLASNLLAAVKNRFLTQADREELINHFESEEEYNRYFSTAKES